MAAATDELIYKIGLIWDKAGFTGLNSSIDKSIKMMAVATAAASAASAAMFAMGKGYAETTDKLIKTSERVNTTTADLQKLTFAAEDNGASMDDVSSSLGSLAKAQEELLRGKGDFEAWGRLGVNPSEYENTSDLLIAISDSVKGLGNTEAIDLMNRVGISPQLLQTLQKGGEGLRELGAEAEALGLISSPAMLNSSQEFMSGWQRATTIFQGVMNKVSSSLLDSTINPALEQFNKFASKHMKQISATLIKIFDALAKASEFIFALLNRLAQPFIKLVDLMGGLEKAAIALGVAMAILKRNMIIAMLPAILAVGVLYLAFDELMAFLKGEESYIGDFFDKIGVGSENAREGMKGIISVLSDIPALLKMSYDGWMNLYDWIIYGIDTVVEKFKGMMQWFDEMDSKIQKVVGSIKEFFSFEMPELPAIPDLSMNNIGSSLGIGDSQSSTPAPVTNNTAMSFNIDGSKDPKAVGEEVRRVLNEEMNKSAMRAGQ